VSQIIDLKTRRGRQLYYQSPTWRAIRLLKLQRDPFCEECLKENIHTLATEIHHKTDIDDLPTLENATNIEGLQSLCKPHHSAKTFQEHREASRFGKKKEYQVVNLKWKI